MLQTILISIIAALLGGSLAIAQSSSEIPAQPKKPKFLAKFDEQFKAADKDGDNALTKSEAENGGMKRIANHFDRLDANKDNKVTREEIRALIRGKISS